MPTPLELSENLTDFLKDSKEGVVKRAGEKRDLITMVLPYRGSFPVSVVHVPKPEPRIMLSIARFAAYGYDAEALALTVEGYVAASPEGNPLTGEEWAPGEMEDLALNHQGIERGLLHEAVMYVVADRQGDYLWKTMPYEYGGPDGLDLTWIEWPAEREAEVEEHAIVQAVRKIQRREVPSPLPSPWPRSRSYADAYTTQVLMDDGNPVVIWADRELQANLEHLRTIATHAHPN